MVCKVTKADMLCICPIVQQVVGIGTALSNIVKTARDIYDFALINFYKSEIPTGDYNKASNYIKENLNQHISYIGIGILRAIPVVGTLYSYRVCKKAQLIDPEGFNKAMK